MGERDGSERITLYAWFSFLWIKKGEPSILYPECASQILKALQHPPIICGTLDKQAGGEIKVKQKAQLDPHMPNRPAKEKKCERNGSRDGFL